MSANNAADKLVELLQFFESKTLDFYHSILNQVANGLNLDLSEASQVLGWSTGALVVLMIVLTLARKWLGLVFNIIIFIIGAEIVRRLFF